MDSTATLDSELSHLRLSSPPRGRQSEVGGVEAPGRPDRRPSSPRSLHRGLGDGAERRTPGGQEELRNLLSELGIDLTITPYSSSDHHSSPGVFCKNILLKDRKQQFYLIITHEDKDLDLKKLKRDLGAYRNFSFASPQDLEELLRVKPGGVTPLGLMYDSNKKIRVVTDSCLNNGNVLNFHPLNSEETCLLKYEQLEHFLTHLGIHLCVLDM